MKNLTSIKAYSGNEPYIFISYSHIDSIVVYEFIKTLEENEYRFWYDEGIEPGINFAKKLFLKIRNCEILIVFLSQDSIQSGHVVNEIGIAFEENKKIIPILLTENLVLPDEVRYYIGSIQHSTKLNKEQNNFDDIYSILPDVVRNNYKIENHILLKAKENVKNIKIPDDVVMIGEGAFKNNLTLESVDLNKVKKIEAEAFRNCIKLKEIIIPKSVLSVGNSAFRDCISLVNLTIEDSVHPYIEVENRAFENCTNLTNIILSNSVGELYSGVFNSCKNLKTINLPKGLTIIGESAFSSCINLESIELPPELTKIDDLAFNGCSQLKNINLNTKLSKIGKYAFRDCSALLKIEIPKSVYQIGDNPFKDCCNLSSLNVDPKNRHFKSVNDVLFNKNKSLIISYSIGKREKRFEIPDSVVNVLNSAFFNCKHLEYVVVPDTIKNIDEEAFSNCTGLKEIDLPDSVEKIDDICFKNCKSLKKVVLSKSINKFGWGLFNGCNESLVIHCEPNTLSHEYCKDKKLKIKLIETYIRITTA